MSLLKNGTFEDVVAGSGAPRAWEVADWSPESARRPIKLVAEKDAGADGHPVARVVSESHGGNLVVRQDVKRPGSGTYLLAVTCRPDPGASAYASVVAIAGGRNLVYENTQRVSAANAWTTLELVCRTPPRTELVRVLLRTNRGACFAAASLVLLDDSDTRNEPSTGKALAAKQSDVGYDEAFDRERKAKMSVNELAWETLLEENLGTFYLPRYRQVKERRGTTAWDYVADQPGLPRVLLIGDSISRGYTVPTRQALSGRVNLHRAPANCGPTTMGLKKLDVWLGDGTWDLIHFNFGIHDRHSAPEDYAERLETIVERLKVTGAELIFATSTPLPKDSDTYPHGACAVLNEAAVEVMARHGIPVNDLYAAVLPYLDEYQNPRDCHFNGEGYRFLGARVAEKILDALGLETP